MQFSAPTYHLLPLSPTHSSHQPLSVFSFSFSVLDQASRSYKTAHNVIFIQRFKYLSFDVSGGRGI